MQNINPVYFLQPVVVIAVSFGLVIYWHYRRSFSSAVLLYSLLTYAGAIALKVVLQALTFTSFIAQFAHNAVAQGFYLGIQTVIFEVGGAFLVAAFAVSRNKFSSKDAEAYGIGLAFWENGVLLGIFPLINLIVYYATLASGSQAAQLLYSNLISTQPQLFSSSPDILSAIGYGVLERISSLLLHFSWGYLCVLAAFFHKRSFLLLALPMGLIDFIVPFASSMTIPVFELLAFVIAIISLVLARGTTRGLSYKFN